ncbi:hypothetical protein [Pseudonocardia acaciae]|uniref:hypothetical protein n=1 Tax=Pseudonocardia acaciae TaxID=551276 RepID=UPI0007E8D001|nr:hypothetical protein [Pseudonocardia acaciae]
MPGIRSPKGRGAAYRALWQWPLRSPARLIGCLVVLAALVIGANAAFGLLPARTGGTGVFGSDPSGSVTPTPPAGALPNAQPRNEPTRLPPVPELTPETLPLSKAPPAALTVATRWTQAWAKHPADGATATWVNGLRPYTTDEYLAVLSTVDTANVPATKVTGAARAVLVSPRSVRVEVPTDAVRLVVLVVNTGTEWRVAGYDRAPDPAAAPNPDNADAGRPATGR